MADPAAPSSTPELLTLTAEIVAAHLASDTVEAADVPALILSVHDTLAHVGTPAPEQPKQEPAVPIKRSIQPDYLICLEDGAKVTMLQRFGLTPDTYRAKWGCRGTIP